MSSHTPKKTLLSAWSFRAILIQLLLPDGIGLNCEGSVFFADEKMRSEIKQQYPALWDRIEKRQQFIRKEIGIQISDDLLPLSNNCAYYSPFCLMPERVLVVD